MERLYVLFDTFSSRKGSDNRFAELTANVILSVPGLIKQIICTGNLYRKMLVQCYSAIRNAMLQGTVILQSSMKN